MKVQCMWACDNLWYASHGFSATETDSSLTKEHYAPLTCTMELIHSVISTVFTESCAVIFQSS